jgi:hypothetical protein
MSRHLFRTNDVRLPRPLVGSVVRVDRDPIPMIGVAIVSIISGIFGFALGLML